MPRAMKKPVMATKGSGITAHAVSAGDIHSMKPSDVPRLKITVAICTQPNDTAMRTMRTSLTARDIKSPVPKRLKKFAPWYWMWLNSRLRRS